MPLALGVRENERIFIGDDIAIAVVKQEGGYTRVVIDAPKEKKIVREKLAEGDLREKLLNHQQD
ncbi:carbon storage regulator [Marinococcus halophilus]|uniref:carbon storage regulator n=1 Tax=Marinococcus halophilus TaxID=1371 RepID=UPI0015C49037|nr:carbon storage regulator [Marinococcus halophilus]